MIRLILDSRPLISEGGSPAELEGALLEAAQALAFLRPLVPYPGWCFDRDWDNPDLAFQLRQKIWAHFRDHQREARMPFPWHGGTRINLYLGNDLSKQVFIGGCYEPNELSFVGEFLEPGMTFIDVGANDGLYSLFAATRVGRSGRLLAFEPSDREFRRLADNIQLNGLTNVETFRVALSSFCGESELNVAVPEHAGHNTLGTFRYEGVGLERKERVEVSTLDEMAARLDLRRVDFIKIDAEGAEGGLLEGAQSVLRKMRPALLLELPDPALHDQGPGRGDVFERLLSAGYDIYCFDPVRGVPIRAGAAAYGGSVVALPVERPMKEYSCRLESLVGGLPAAPLAAEAPESGSRPEPELRGGCAMEKVSIDSVRRYWDARPCNVRHSKKAAGSREYFDEVEARKYFVEPHIPAFAEFERWRGQKVLEVGCGIGTDTINFARQAACVTAVDLSEESLRVARRRAAVFGLAGRIQFYRADAERLSEFVPVSAHDLVYSFGVIHHTPHPGRVLDEIRKYLRPGGTIKIMVYHRWSWKVLWIVARYGRGRLWRLPELVAEYSEAQTGCPVTYVYSRSEARALLESHGYQVSDLRVEHIFRFDIPEYVEHRYRTVWYFRWLPPGVFRWLERRLGWHVCVTARVPGSSGESPALRGSPECGK